MEICEPKPPETLWATPGLLRDTFTFLHYEGKVLRVLEIKQPRENILIQDGLGGGH